MVNERVAKELISVARELSALDFEVILDPDAVDALATKLLARLSAPKSRQLRTYGIDIRSSDTLESLARAWATVLLS